MPARTVRGAVARSVGADEPLDVLGDEIGLDVDRRADLLAGELGDRQRVRDEIDSKAGAIDFVDR